MCNFRVLLRKQRIPVWSVNLMITLMLSFRPVVLIMWRTVESLCRVSNKIHSLFLYEKSRRESDSQAAYLVIWIPPGWRSRRQMAPRTAECHQQLTSLCSLSLARSLTPCEHPVLLSTLSSPVSPNQSAISRWHVASVLVLLSLFIKKKKKSCQDWELQKEMSEGQIVTWMWILCL